MDEFGAGPENVDERERADVQRGCQTAKGECKDRSGARDDMTLFPARAGGASSRVARYGATVEDAQAVLDSQRSTASPTGRKRQREQKRFIEAGAEFFAAEDFDDLRK